MSAESELAASLAAYDRISTEYADRRALRERELAKASAQLKERFVKQGAVAQKLIEHYRELGARQRKAGGWSTSATVEDREEHFSFVMKPQDEPGGAAQWSASPAPAAPAPEPPPAPARRHQERPAVEDDDFSNEKWMH